jgi:hypothetical protein
VQIPGASMFISSVGTCVNKFKRIGGQLRTIFKRDGFGGSKWVVCTTPALFPTDGVVQIPGASMFISSVGTCVKKFKRVGGQLWTI